MCRARQKPGDGSGVLCARWQARRASAFAEASAQRAERRVLRAAQNAGPQHLLAYRRSVAPQFMGILGDELNLVPHPRAARGLENLLDKKSSFANLLYCMAMQLAGPSKMPRT
jgi:hypothetical protein